MHYQVYSLAEEFESFLGDPYSKTTAFSYENCAALDVQEAFPHEIAANLEKWGLHKYYAPVEYGGVMESYEQALMLMRLVARRDLTVAIGHGKTYLGSVCVWVGASKEQACKLGFAVANGKIVSLALTERLHGSDIMANDFSAEFDGEGFLLNGEKWLINNATRGDALTVFVRTDPNGGARGYSVFLVEKDKISPETYQCLEKVKTHGIRGADISGIQFNNAWISKDALVGQLGYGLEIVLKALQITRTLCASLSLGAADNALRITYQFATQRQLYGKKLLEIPHTRKVLLDAYSDLLIAEVLSITASRAIHVITEQMSLVSAVTKYFVPSSIELMIDKLSTVLGARAYLLDVFEHGRFQKVERDHRIVGLFDGNTLVNLQVIINQLKSLSKWRHNKRVDSETQIISFPIASELENHAKAQRRKEEIILNYSGANGFDIITLFDLTAQLPAFVREKLSITTRGQDAVVNSLPGALEKIDNYCQTHSQSKNLPIIKDYVSIILDELQKFDNEVLNTDWVINSIPTKCFTLAEKYSTFYAAAACIQFWLHNQGNMDSNSQITLWQDGLWLRVCLERLLSKLNIYVTTSDVAETAFLQDLDLQYHNRLLFSLLPLKLSEACSSVVARRAQYAL